MQRIWNSYFVYPAMQYRNIEFNQTLIKNLHIYMKMIT